MIRARVVGLFNHLVAVSLRVCRIGTFLFVAEGLICLTPIIAQAPEKAQSVGVTGDNEDIRRIEPLYEDPNLCYPISKETNQETTR